MVALDRPQRLRVTKMSIRIVRLGSPRTDDEGLRLGTVRRPPRGVRKTALAERDFYDVWYPNLAPSEALLKQHFAIADDDEMAWRRFSRMFLAEMKQKDASRTLDVLAALSAQTNFALGCYCSHEARCHRSLLRQLLSARGAAIETW